MSALTPTPKMTASAVAGAVTVILVWSVGLAGLSVPTAVAAAVTLLITFGAGYLKSEPTS